VGVATDIPCVIAPNTYSRTERGAIIQQSLQWSDQDSAVDGSKKVNGRIAAGRNLRIRNPFESEDVSRAEFCRRPSLLCSDGRADEGDGGREDTSKALHLSPQKKDDDRPAATVRLVFM